MKFAVNEQDQTSCRPVQPRCATAASRSGMPIWTPRPTVEAPQKKGSEAVAGARVSRRAQTKLQLARNSTERKYREDSDRGIEKNAARGDSRKRRNAPNVEITGWIFRMTLQQSGFMFEREREKDSATAGRGNRKEQKLHVEMLNLAKLAEIRNRNAETSSESGHVQKTLTSASNIRFSGSATRSPSPKGARDRTSHGP